MAEPLVLPEPLVVAEPLVLPEPLWRLMERRHVEAIDRLTADHLDRQSRGRPHPVIDFLFTYYRTSVGTLRRWHPGPGYLLEGAQHTERADWRHYRQDTARGHTGLVVCTDSVWRRAGAKIDRWHRIITATRGRPGQTGCFGLHEWAMVYGSRHEDIRHDHLPLRLPQDQIDRVVNQSVLRCTHFDAYRFFTPPAEPRNTLALSADGRADVEQPGCLHAGMDLYRAAAEMEAGCPSELLRDCLTAALEAREIDMRASPYDLSGYGYSPIPIETDEGRAQYAAFQRRWIKRTNGLRVRLESAVAGMNHAISV